MDLVMIDCTLDVLNNGHKAFWHIAWDIRTHEIHSYYTNLLSHLIVITNKTHMLMPVILKRKLSFLASRS